MQLYNNLSAKERAELIEQAGKERLTISFYIYAKIGNPEMFRNHLFLSWNELDVLGRIYVAHEGINAQLSVPADHFQKFKNHLDSISFLENARLNIALEHDNFAFLKLKVKVRDKILADGLNDTTFDVTNKGIHVGADKFNELIDNPNTILVDMRNHYESEIGHFKNAITPDVDTFRESLSIIEDDLKEHKEDKNLVMYLQEEFAVKKLVHIISIKALKTCINWKAESLIMFDKLKHKVWKISLLGKTLCSMNGVLSAFQKT